MDRFTKFLLPTIYAGVIAVMIVCVTLVVSGVKSYLKEEEKYNFAIDDVFISDVISVAKTDNNTIIRPYTSDKVKVGRYFYDYEADSNKQTSSLIFYENTYIQNNGVDYMSNEEFDVVSVLDGEVISIEDNEIYGKIMKIKHNDNLITVYSNIDNVLVSTGYKVSQGEIIASSNTSKIINDNNSYLHFEVYYKQNAIDPESMYTLSVSELQ